MDLYKTVNYIQSGKVCDCHEPMTWKTHGFRMLHFFYMFGIIKLGEWIVTNFLLN